MKWKLYVDPGVNTGVARSINDELHSCFLWQEPFAPYLEGYEKLVIEMPSINPTDLKKPGASARINDLMGLAKRVGQWAQSLQANETVLVHPHEWKGSVPKHVHNERVLDRLTPHERTLIPKLPKVQLHNVIDAIGLFLWDTGRMRP